MESIFVNAFEGASSLKSNKLQKATARFTNTVVRQVPRLPSLYVFHWPYLIPPIHITGSFNADVWGDALTHRVQVPPHGQRRYRRSMR